MPRVLSAIQFFPRGGSAHVARALTERLPRTGWEAGLVSGSRTDAGPEADARAFYAGLPLHAVDFTPALAAPDPLRCDPGPGTAPMHASYEERVPRRLARPVAAAGLLRGFGRARAALRA